MIGDGYVYGMAVVTFGGHRVIYEKAAGNILFY